MTSWKNYLRPFLFSNSLGKVQWLHFKEKPQDIIKRTVSQGPLGRSQLFVTRVRQLSNGDGGGSEILLDLAKEGKESFKAGLKFLS